MPSDKTLILQPIILQHLQTHMEEIHKLAMQVILIKINLSGLSPLSIGQSNPSNLRLCL